MPKRIQRKRSTGWKKPENTIDVTRSSRWGNLYKIGDQVGCFEWDNLSVQERELFPIRTIMDGKSAVLLFQKFQLPKMDLSFLKGKNLMCWCKEGDTCHADILITISNK